MPLETDFNNTTGPAFQTFSNDVRVITQREKTEGISVHRALGPARETTKIGLAFKGFDDVDTGPGQNPEQYKTNVKLLDVAIKKLTSDAKEYVAELNTIMATKIAIVQNGMNLSAELKERAPESYRQIKILITETKALYARALSAQTRFVELAKINKIGAKALVKQQNVKGADAEANAKIAAIKEKEALKKFLVTFSTAFKASMTKAAAAIQKLKATPTLANYNALMNSAGRDVRAQMNQIPKIKQDPRFKNSDVNKKVPDPGNLIALFTPFDTGNLRLLPNTSTAQNVKTAIDQFNVAYKAAKEKYAAVLAGQLD